jgi:hypothetical protein
MKDYRKTDWGKAKTSSSEPIQGCTGALVTGSTSSKGNMVGETTDFGRPFGENYKVELVIPETGYRYFRGVLNEKGEGATQYSRGARAIPYKGSEKLRRVTKEELLSQADSARKYMELWSKNVTRYGIDDPRGAQAQLIVDPKEGYLLETANFIYDNPDNHAILGPMNDQVFAHANFFCFEKAQTGRSWFRGWLQPG